MSTLAIVAITIISVFLGLFIGLFLTMVAIIKRDHAEASELFDKIKANRKRMRGVRRTEDKDPAA